MSEEIYKKTKFKNSFNPKLVYRDGKLHMKDGSDVKEYHRSWARVCGIVEGEEMVVMPASKYNQMCKDLLFWRAVGGIG